MAQFHTICQISEIPEGEARMFVVGEAMVGLFNVGGALFALDNVCPHAGASLAHGIVEGDVVRCRIHHWRFRIPDGTYLDEERLECNARTFPVRIVDGAVQVGLEGA